MQRPTTAIIIINKRIKGRREELKYPTPMSGTEMRHADKNKTLGDEENEWKK